MRGRVRRHLSFANVASATALFLAIGGGTTAIALKGRNTVDSGDIKRGAVHTSDLHRNAVTGPKVNESTLAQVPEAENADLLDNLDSSFFQAGNGIDGAIAGAIDDDGLGYGEVDLGSATIRIGCAEPPTTVAIAVYDDAGGVQPSPEAPTDVWIAGSHAALDSDGDLFSQPGIDPEQSTTTVEIWSADDVVTRADVNLAWDAANDRCTVAIPLTQNLPGNGASSSAASKRGDRPPAPAGSGISGR
jgi:hypothetical protein